MPPHAEGKSYIHTIHPFVKGRIIYDELYDELHAFSDPMDSHVKHRDHAHCDSLKAALSSLSLSLVVDRRPPTCHSG